MASISRFHLGSIHKIINDTKMMLIDMNTLRTTLLLID